MPTRRFSSLFVTAFACAGLLCAGCNLGRSGSEEVTATRRIERGVTPGQRTLVIDSFNGDVTLRDTSAQEASIAFVKRARAADQEAARELLGRIQIEERGGQEEFAYKLTSGAPDRTSIDVEGHVPQRTRMRLRLRNGDVALSGLHGPLDVENENGDLRIGGASQNVRAETRNGAVEVGLRSVPTEGEIRLRTANGDIELTLPGSSSIEVEARTDAGEIDTGNLSFEDRDLTQSGAGARFAGEMGDGTTTVVLRTQNGDITLRRGTIRRLPDIEPAPRDSTMQDSPPQDSTRRDSTGAMPFGTPPNRSDSLSTPPDTAGSNGNGGAYPLIPSPDSSTSGRRRNNAPSRDTGSNSSSAPLGPSLLRRDSTSQP